MSMQVVQTMLMTCRRPEPANPAATLPAALWLNIFSYCSLDWCVRSAELCALTYLHTRSCTPFCLVCQAARGFYWTVVLASHPSRCKPQLDPSQCDGLGQLAGVQYRHSASAPPALSSRSRRR
jgi:hypothetical protein